MTKEEFEGKLKKDEFLENAEVFGNMYGTPREQTAQTLVEGKNVILEIDVQGARAVKEIHKDAIMVFILPPSQSDLVGRMAARARGEDAKTAKKRLDSASAEIAAAWQFYEHMIVNADIEQAIKEIEEVIRENSGE